MWWVGMKGRTFLPFGTVTIRRRVTVWVMNPGPPLRKPRKGREWGKSLPC